MLRLMCLRTAAAEQCDHIAELRSLRQSRRWGMTERRVLVTGVAGFIGSLPRPPPHRRGPPCTGRRQLLFRHPQEPRGHPPHMLGLAKRTKSYILLASTSEVYGDPVVHPQPETYWGNVNPIGPRGVYDEAKRFAEALTLAYHRSHGLDVRIVRIFNTYGPRLRPADGRVVSNFLVQAMDDKALTVYGDGKQTRSFCYVEDEIRGIVALLESDYVGPVNIGNPNEFTILELAEAVIDVTGSSWEIAFEPLPTDDPTQRKPDITLAKELLGWEPEIQLREGLERTLASYRAEFGDDASGVPRG